MNDNEATQLAEKITRTWRGNIGTEIWYEMLLELHYGPAETAWRNLRDTAEHQPSIAQFKASYRAQLGTAHEPRIDCDTCGGDGWETVEYEVLGLPNRGVKPCKCRAGDDVDKVHKAIIAANNVELAEHGINPAQTRPMQPKPQP